MLTKVSGIVASALGRTLQAKAPATAPSALRQAASTLARMTAASLAGGQWTRGGDFCPALEVERLQASFDRGATDAEIAPLVLDIVDQALPAIATGECLADGDLLEAIMAANTLALAAAAANDGDTLDAAA